MSHDLVYFDVFLLFMTLKLFPASIQAWCPRCVETLASPGAVVPAERVRRAAETPGRMAGTLLAQILEGWMLTKVRV